MRFSVFGGEDGYIRLLIAYLRAKKLVYDERVKMYSMALNKGAE